MIWTQRRVLIKFFFQVLEQDSTSTGNKPKLAESILNFFPGFDAFTLPPPSVDPKMMQCIHKKKNQLNPSFLSGIELFKVKMNKMLAPKRSFNDGEFVTGEGKFFLAVFSMSYNLFSSKLHKPNFHKHLSFHLNIAA